MSKAIIYILGKHGEIADHRTSAGYIAGKLKGKSEKYSYAAGEDVPVFESASNMKAYLSGATGKEVSKVFILTHGNWAEVEGRRGDMDAPTMAYHLWNQGGFQEWAGHLKNGGVGRVNLLSCMSGSPHPGTGEIFVQQVASTLSGLIPKGK